MIDVHNIRWLNVIKNEENGKLKNPKIMDRNNLHLH